MYLALCCWIAHLHAPVVLGRAGFQGNPAHKKTACSVAQTEPCLITDMNHLVCQVSKL